MPDPPLSALDSLLCSEVLPESPVLNGLIRSRSTKSASANTNGRPRTLLTDYDETLYSERALQQKLYDQKLSLDLSSWGKLCGIRRKWWLHAYKIYMDHGLPLETLQMAITFLDRFIKKFYDEHNGDIEDGPSLDCLFDAALWCSNMVLDDSAGYSEASTDRKNPDNVQLSIQLMLGITQWDVIDCTAASFVPHFMEEAQVRQYHGLHQQILAVTTLFMIDENITAHVLPAHLAALAVVFQSWFFIESAFTNRPPEELAAIGLPNSTDFMRRAVVLLLTSTNMSLIYFLQMADYVLTHLFTLKWQDGFSPLTAWKFVCVTKELFGSLPHLEQACLPSLLADSLDDSLDMAVAK